MSSAPEAGNLVNYDGSPLCEVEIDGIDYRIDSGKQGTALCISQRQAGTWDWSYGGEAKWDVGNLRSKAYERRTLTALSRAFAEALERAD